MKRHPSLVIWLLSLALLLPAAGQVPGPPTRPRAVQPAQALNPPPGQRPEAPQLLSQNYRLTFSGKQGEKQLGVLTALTCSPVITLAGTLEQAEIPTLISVNGRLEEQEGRVLFHYSIGFRVPVPTSTYSSPGAPQQLVRNIEYQDHQCSGTVRMQAGKTYELLKSGPVAYSVTVAPEPE